MSPIYPRLTLLLSESLNLIQKYSLRSSLFILVYDQLSTSTKSKLSQSLVESQLLRDTRGLMIPS